MAKKKTTGGGKSAARGSGVQPLRNQIDKIDVQLIELFNARARLAKEIGRRKTDAGDDVFSPARESEVLARIMELNKGPLDERAIRAIFREVMSGSRALQRALRVAYLGPEYSFSHLAALERFGSSVEYIPAANIAGVFEIVNRGQAELGLVPIENSTDGRVADTLDMFIRLPLKICGEVSLRIHQNLLSMAPMGEIRRVYSKWQALSQCRHWLATNLPQATLHEVQSTSTAVNLAKSEKSAGAIASRQAGAAYGVPVVSADIEDRPNNFTRFAVIGHQTVDRTGKDKTTVMFEMVDEPGALADALMIMKKNEVSMSWIESFPGPPSGKKRQYLFFADLEGHLKDGKIDRTIQGLEKRCAKVVVLGAFPVGVQYD